MPEQQKSRLDRELDEILTKKSKEPIPFSSHPKAPKTKGKAATENGLGLVRDAWSFLKSFPLLMAFVFAIAARMVVDASPLLALFFALGTVLSLYVPGIVRLSQPADTGKPEVKYWRGKPYTSQVKDAVSRHPVDSIKRYFDRRR